MATAQPTPGDTEYTIFHRGAPIGREVVHVARTRDGWIYLMCNKEKFWVELCRRIDRPEWPFSCWSFSPRAG